VCVRTDPQQVSGRSISDIEIDHLEYILCRRWNNKGFADLCFSNSVCTVCCLPNCIRTGDNLAQVLLELYPSSKRTEWLNAILSQLEIMGILPHNYMDFFQLQVVMFCCRVMSHWTEHWRHRSIRSRILSEVNADSTFKGVGSNEYKFISSIFICTIPPKAAESKFWQGG